MTDIRAFQQTAGQGSQCDKQTRQPGEFSYNNQIEQPVLPVGCRCNVKVVTELLSIRYGNNKCTFCDFLSVNFNMPFERFVLPKMFDGQPGIYNQATPPAMCEFV